MRAADHSTSDGSMGCRSPSVVPRLDVPIRVAELGARGAARSRRRANSLPLAPLLFSYFYYFLLPPAPRARPSGLLEIETSPLSYLALAGAKRLAGALGRGFTTVRDPGGGDAGLAQAIREGLTAGAQVPVLRARAEPDWRPWRSAAARAGLLPGSGHMAEVVDGVDALRRAPASGCAAARTPSRSWPRAGSSRRRIRSACRSTRRRRSAPSPRRRPAAAVTWPPMPTRRRRSRWPWPTGSAPSSTGTCWTRRPPP